MCGRSWDPLVGEETKNESLLRSPLWAYELFISIPKFLSFPPYNQSAAGCSDPIVRRRWRLSTPQVSSIPYRRLQHKMAEGSPFGCDIFDLRWISDLGVHHSLIGDIGGILQISYV